VIGDKRAPAEPGSSTLESQLDSHVRGKSGQTGKLGLLSEDRWIADAKYGAPAMSASPGPTQ
jgi:hypothetical protein